jgi:WD repeat-containing protein 76
MMEMSEYERARLARMERNEKVLRDLGLNKSKIDMTSSTKKKKKASSRGLTGRKRKKASPLPRRKSRRVQGLPSDGVYIEAVLPGGKPVLSKGDTTVRKSTPKASETLAPRKRYEHPRKDLNSRELDSKPLTSSSTFEMSTAVNYLSSLPKSEKKKTKKKMSSSLNDLELEESSIAKMTPDRIYSVAVRPCSSSFVIAAGDKSGHLGLWNFSSQSSTENDGVSCWRPCNAVINTLHWMDSDRLLLTSYDGTIRIADFSAQRLNFVYGLDEDDSSWIQYSTYCDLSKCLYV